MLGRVLSEEERLRSTFEGSQGHPSFTWIRGQLLEKEDTFIAGGSTYGLTSLTSQGQHGGHYPPSATSSSSDLHAQGWGDTMKRTHVYKAHLTNHRITIGAARFLQDQVNFRKRQLIVVLCSNLKTES